MFQLILVLHIAGGSLALLSGSLAALSAKGNQRHRQAGRVFVYCMLLTAISAISLSIIHPGPFLLAIGCFTLYLTLSGWIWVWRVPQERKLRWDRYTGAFGVLTAGFMLYRAVAGFESLSYVLLVFGLLLLGFALRDFRGRKAAAGNIQRHAGKIGGAYIASITAFLVVNVNFLPAYLVWLSPTLIGTIILSLAIRKWQRKHQRPAPAQ